MTWEGLSPPYATIVADPPWDYGNDAKRWASGSVLKAGALMHRSRFEYSAMPVEEIAALDVKGLADSSAWLFLWTTNRHIFRTPEVLVPWGFTYRQTLVWHKTLQPSPFGGTLAPNTAEFLIVAARGRPRVTGRLAGSVFDAPRARLHSSKPSLFFDAIEQAVDGPYVELFARQPRLGWDHWGFGYEGADAIRLQPEAGAESAARPWRPPRATRVAQ